jgi:pilus assembly protein CpaB
VNVIASVQLIDIDPNFQTELPNLTTSVVSPGPESYTQCGEACIATGTDLALNIEAADEGAVQGRAELDAAYQQSVYVVPSEDQRPRLVTQTIVQDVTVLGVGNFAEETETKTEATSADGQPAPEEEIAATEEPKDPEVITLVVTPQDATAIDYMIRTGIELTLVMRGAGDEYVESTQPVTLQFIMDQYNIPYPSKLSYSQYQRLDELDGSVQVYDEFGNPIPQ